MVEVVRNDNGTPGNADDDVFLYETIVSTAGQGNPGSDEFCTSLTTRCSAEPTKHSQTKTRTHPLPTRPARHRITVNPRKETVT